MIGDYPSLAQFQNYIHKVIVLKKAVKANNVFMFETPVNGNLLSHFILLVGLDEKLFGDNLPSPDVSSVNIGELIAFSEATLSKKWT